MYIPATYWYDPCQAAIETVRRLQTPLHYHLRRHDYVAFQKELATGTNPFIPDECGRTPLDLALLMTEDIVITSLCTSFPVDFLVKTLEHDAKYPAKFKPHYAQTYESMYDHPNALRLTAAAEPETMSHFGTGAPKEYPRFFPTPFPTYRHDTVPTHVYDSLLSAEEDRLKRKLKAAKARKKPEPSLEKKRGGNSRVSFAETNNSGSSSNSSSNSGASSPTRRAEKEQEEAAEATYDVKPVKGAILRPPSASALQKLFQDQMVVVVEDAVQQPTRRTVRRRMGQLLGQLRGLERVTNLLLTCEPLRAQAIDFRIGIARPPPEGAKKAFPDFVFEYLTYPYLFLATLQNLFEMYPYSLSEKPWNPKSVADARRLVNLVIYKRLRGHEVLQFLAQLPRYICKYIVTLGPDYFRPSSELSQFLMHYAFCMDASDLFYFASRMSRPFSVPDVFDWDELIRTLSVHRTRFAAFLIPLITCRLKERVQKRLAPEEEAAPAERLSLAYPFEERYLTKDFLRDFASLFGTEDTQKLESILAWWRYEVARMLDGAPRARFPPSTYATSASVVPPDAPPPLHVRYGTKEEEEEPAEDRFPGPYDSRVHPL